MKFHDHFSGLKRQLNYDGFIILFLTQWKVYDTMYFEEPAREKPIAKETGVMIIMEGQLVFWVQEVIQPLAQFLALKETMTPSA